MSNSEKFGVELRVTCPECGRNFPPHSLVAHLTSKLHGLTLEQAREVARPAIEARRERIQRLGATDQVGIAQRLVELREKALLYGVEARRREYSGPVRDLFQRAADYCDARRAEILRDLEARD